MRFSSVLRLAVSLALTCALAGCGDDGGDVDGGGGGGDGGEGGVGRDCAEPSDCDDMIDCTIDECEEGHCLNRVPDEDGDGHGSAMCMNAAGMALGDDCDDNDERRGPFPDGPGGEEMGYGCDGSDNDCDGTVDNDCECVTGEMQECGIAGGRCIPGMQMCEGGRWGACEGAIGPINEICGNEEDDDCNGEYDENVIPYWVDRDGDGAGSGDVLFDCAVPDNGAGTLPARDCDDRDPMLSPMQPEVCDDIDNNCNGLHDEGFVEWYYQDADGDGYGDDYVRIQTCLPPAGWVTQPHDCNDDAGDMLAAAMNPGETEVCNDMDGDAPRPVDNDCDELIDEGCPCTMAGETRECETRHQGPAYSMGMVCTPGMQTCTGGTWGSTCVGGNRPTEEDCDGEQSDTDDDDCDGAHDEGLRTQGFLDLDEDGQGGGAEASRIASEGICEGMVGFATQGNDCDESDPEVYFGRTDYASEERLGAAPAWDFNCDGWEEPEFPGMYLVTCAEGDDPCAREGEEFLEFVPRRGMGPPRKAMCGETGTLYRCERMGSTCMITMGMADVLQRCR